jgi:hypothetical protein
MRLFACNRCGNRLYFENTKCERCGFAVGFLQSTMTMTTVRNSHKGLRALNGRPETLTYCANHQYDVCNWLIPAGQDNAYCKACSLNHTIPDLDCYENIALWRKMELAKHWLVYSLMRFNLPLDAAPCREHGLRFQFLRDDERNGPVTTGHADGLVTINLAEANDAEREKMRLAMHEPYRTLLGHFRHEVGHFYWDRLIAYSGEVDAFRMLFGDEREDYSEALKRHYENGPPKNWHQTHISSYATSHPWEDWAECWAHYFHIIDTIDTAVATGMEIDADTQHTLSQLCDPYRTESFEDMVPVWFALSEAINNLNRSMGQPDLYPFLLSSPVIEKLHFIHKVVAQTRMAQAA